ncbi:MAG: hypothetical protein KGZ25_11635, partial [Planctomycetes bacterium]|nr:hypothetical protein [Planctomycetota bacterium]
MNTPENHQKSDLEISAELRQDLRNLDGEPPGIPPKIDKSVLDEAHRRLRSRPRIIVLRRVAAGLAAAAAFILCVTLFLPGRMREEAIQTPPRAAA